MAFTKATQPKAYGDTEIVITSITNALKVNSDFTWITAITGEAIQAEFQIDAGDERVFTLTFTGQGNTPEAKFFALVDETGKGTVTLTFESMGSYKFTNIEANLNLPEPIYFTNDVLVEIGHAPAEMRNSIQLMM